MYLCNLIIKYMSARHTFNFLNFPRESEGVRLYFVRVDSFARIDDARFNTLWLD